MNTANRNLSERIDWPLLFLYFIIASIGITAVYTVEYSSFSEPFFDMSKSHMKQLMWLGIALFFGLIILFTDSKFFYSISYLSYLIGILLLFSTFVLASEVKGSHSFIKFGGFSFQPGELHKMFTALALARFISNSETGFKRLNERLIAAAIVLFPTLIIILQNETGLALVYFSFFFAMYREGLPNAIMFIAFGSIALVLCSLLIESVPLVITLTTLLGLFLWFLRNQIKKNRFVLIVILSVYTIAIVFSQVAVPFAFKKVLKGYQVERIYSMFGQDVPIEFRKPGQLPKQDADYNVRQSKIAIGSGGLLGKGFMNGTQTKGSFVPEQNTDFVFCGIGEQFGFWGSTVLVILYTLLIWRVVVIAERQRSTFSRVYAYSVAGILFFHFAINLGMTMGLAPVIGITLPLLSYGGTSLLSFSLMFFLLLRLDADKHILIK